MYNYHVMIMQKVNLLSVPSNMKKVMFFNITNLVVPNNLLPPPYLSSSPTNIIFTLYMHDKYIVHNQQAKDVYAFPSPHYACT